MLGSAKVMAMVATSDPEAAQHFYCDVLGLRLLQDTPFALVVDAGGTMMRIQKVENVVTPPYTSLGWEVDDIASVVQGLTEAGVVFERFDFLSQDELGIWQAPDGAAVAWFKDPDGNMLSLTQFLPEG
jgi:catechol 2,3-dioxygenase-like lactoylglutathione lyase family enzyme